MMELNAISWYLGLKVFLPPLKTNMLNCKSIALSQWLPSFQTMHYGHKKSYNYFHTKF